ncbi:hypothetical protein QTP86_026963 [Hemibagrus guttatus]|nr:hypothetical protein QTP86_026963 [Hemibagrus guttatus]
MSDFYIKPGNQERGWNDPPQFSYGSQTNTGGQKRNLLNKRVPPPQLSAHTDPLIQSDVQESFEVSVNEYINTGSKGPSSGIHYGSPAMNSIPPSNPVPPPVAGFTPPPKSHGSSGGAADSHQSSPKIQPDSTAPAEDEPNLNDVQAPLLWALTACRQTVKKQVCDDVDRRLKIFEEMWRSGKLSLAVKRRMNGLSQELRNKNWDKADEIHRALMVDYVNEVIQWMVGVKRLIAETRGLSPELLQADAALPSEASADPDH